MIGTASDPPSTVDLGPARSGVATRALSHGECVKLVRSPERYRPALVSVDGREPATLRCFVVDNGDFLVPGDRALVRAAAGRTVTITVTPRGRAGWS